MIGQVIQMTPLNSSLSYNSNSEDTSRVHVITYINAPVFVSLTLVNSITQRLSSALQCSSAQV
jgi:hypothetical protein